MLQDPRTINLSGVNCYLLRTGDGFVLIDTGLAAKRAELVRQLAVAGCAPGNLRQVILTHGDVDHAGNFAYLRAMFGAQIAMHCGDAGMVEHGDMSWNRKTKPDKITVMGRLLVKMGGMVVRFSGAQGSVDTFSPDILLEDGQHLSGHGLDAIVRQIPGHSKGSIGIITASGALFCGDFLMNMLRPAPHFMIDDLGDFDASLAKLRSFSVGIVYPGHGKPFPMAVLAGKHRYCEGDQ